MPIWWYSYFVNDVYRHSRIQFVLWAIAWVGVACSPPQSAKPTATPIPPHRSDVTYPSLSPEKGERGRQPFSHRFKFEGESYKVSVSLDTAVLAAARGAKKVVKMVTPVPKDEWRAGLQWALIGDPALASFYKGLSSKLRAIKKRAGLDDDRFAELISNFVQSIDYCSAPDQPPKYPIETLADRCGDCDDKSRLLAGLLHHEGYDVALLVFEKENHMAVGIRVPDEGFMGSGYAYIETTSPSYIGFPSYEYSEVKLNTTPALVLLGERPKGFGKSVQVRFLYDTLNQEREKAETCQRQLRRSQQKLESLKAEYESLGAALDKGKGTLEAEAYNDLVDETNRAGDKFNRQVAAHNELVQQNNRSADIVSLIFDHPDNRHGVYLKVRSLLK